MIDVSNEDILPGAIVEIIWRESNLEAICKAS